MGGDGIVVAYGVDVFVGLAFDVDLGGVAIEERREIVFDGLLVGGEFGGLEDDGDVDVVDGVAGGVHEGEGVLEEDLGIGVFVLGMVVGEKLADVGFGESAEDGIGEGVEEDIAIGVGGAAFVVLEGVAPDDEREIGFEAVEVEAVSDSEGLVHHGGLGGDVRIVVFDLWSRW